MKKLKEEVARAQSRESRLSVPHWDGTPLDDDDDDDDDDDTPQIILPSNEQEKGGEGNQAEGGKGGSMPGSAQGPGLDTLEENTLVNAKRPSTRMTDELLENDGDLMENDLLSNVQYQHSQQEDHGLLKSSAESTNHDVEDDATLESSSRSQYYNQMLVAEIHRLKKELRDMNDDIEQLTLEKFKIATEKDCTPAAMLFFSTLHDPNMVPTIQQLIIQLSR